MPTDQLRPSRNCEERLQAGMPIDRAYISSRITQIYSTLADCGVFVARLKSHDDYLWLSREILNIETAIDTVRHDLNVQGESL